MSCFRVFVAKVRFANEVDTDSNTEHTESELFLGPGQLSGLDDTPCTESEGFSVLSVSSVLNDY